MWRALCIGLLCSCGIGSSEIVGHYDLTCSGTDAGWLEISADLVVTLDPADQPHLTDQHVTADGDAYQIDVTTHQTLGEGGYIEHRTQVKLDHDGGAGTITSSSTSQPTPTVSCASLVATRGVGSSQIAGTLAELRGLFVFGGHLIQERLRSGWSMRLSSLTSFEATRARPCCQRLSR